jgi:iron complex transport system substrate-binding protein
MIRATLLASGMLSLAMCQSLSAQTPPALTPRPERIISLNMCTDQLLLDLAPTGQIVGLSPFARDVARSWAAGKVEALPILSGTAEEVMVLKPDLVVAGRFTRRATREFIRERGIPLEEFDAARTLIEAKRQIARFGELTGSVAQAAARNAQIDAAAANLKAAASSAPTIRVLPLSRRGWVSGRESLMSDLLRQAGLINAASELGLRAGGFVTLEAIVKLRPDAILISRDDDKAEDQGRAMLLHPAIQELFPPARRIIIPERLTVCGGPMLADAMTMLARQISQLKPRDAAAR